MQDFRVFQSALPHKDYFDFLYKAYFGRRCKKKLRRNTARVANYGDSPLAVFRTKP